MASRWPSVDNRSRPGESRYNRVSLIQEHCMSTTEQTNLTGGLIERLADAVIFADRDGLIQLWNPAAQAVFGYGADEVLGQRLDVLIPERLRPSHWAAFDAAIETGKTKHGRKSKTTRSIHKDGSVLYVDLSFALVEDANRHVLGAVAVARDITSRFLAEKESRRRMAKLEEQVRAFEKQEA
jgi:PAS domain S-box-containing protein